jgi:hypothetical protein
MLAGANIALMGATTLRPWSQSARPRKARQIAEHRYGSCEELEYPRVAVGVWDVGPSAALRPLAREPYGGTNPIGGMLITDEHDASARDGTSAAARLLEIATRNADELLDEAKTEAASIVATAQAEAEQVHAELEETRAEQNAELERQRTTVLADLAERQAALKAEVARLEQLEQEHRNRMRKYLTQQLAQIEPNPS